MAFANINSPVDPNKKKKLTSAGSGFFEMGGVSGLRQDQMLVFDNLFDSQDSRNRQGRSTTISSKSGQFGDRLAEERTAAANFSKLSKEEQEAERAKKKRLFSLGQDDPSLLRRVLFAG